MNKGKIVILTGAGISAESGLQTFRDADGLWENHRVEDVATPEAWHKNPEMVLRFYNERRKNVLLAQPNAAHFGLVSLEDKYEVQIITQNIDDLHERAGTTNVLHLHGEILKMRSVNKPDVYYPVNGDIKIGDVDADGAQLRPHIVWFGEPVTMMEEAIRIAEEADIFIIIGTSLAVHPAASLLYYVPRGIPKFILDKFIPSVYSLRNVSLIEKPATEGIVELLKVLMY